MYLPVHKRLTSTFIIARTETELAIHADNDFATVAFLRIKQALLEPKERQDFDSMQVPPLLNEDLFRVRDAVTQSQKHNESRIREGRPASSLENEIVSTSSSKSLNSWVAISNVHRNVATSTLEEISVEEEVKECFSLLKGTHV